MGIGKGVEVKVDVDFTSPDMFFVMAVKGGGGPKVNGQWPLKKTEIVYRRPLNIPEINVQVNYSHNALS